jgi:hypothetical protein
MCKYATLAQQIDTVADYQNLLATDVQVLSMYTINNISFLKFFL